MPSIKELDAKFKKTHKPYFFKKGKMRGTLPRDFDKQFHSDHAELNKILREAGIKGRYR